MAIKVKKDGRTILTGQDYTRHKYEVWLKQGKCCADCGFYLPFSRAEFHHYQQRGMGGSTRHDIDPKNRMLCSGPAGCHERARFEKQRDKRAAMEQARQGQP